MDVYVARQPIFDPMQRVAAYELLYRSNGTATNSGTFDDNQATANVAVNAFIAIGIQALTGGRRAFINCAREMLVAEHITALPPEAIVIEVLEDVEPDEEVIAACRALKEAGYSLALDDLADYNGVQQVLFDLADIIKVDFMLADEETKRTLPDRIGRSRIRFLAEKVETAEEFQAARDWGYVLFQGYFFAKPQVVAGKTVPGFKLNYLRLLREINSPETDFDRLETILKSDTSLPYQLLRMINSAAYGWRHRIESIRHALVAVGIREVRKWASLICLSQMADDKPREVMVQCIIRAGFCEALAAPLGLADRAPDLFLTGLFSLLDVIVERPMEESLKDLALSSDVRSALLEGEGPLADVLHLAVGYMRGDWTGLDGEADKLRAAGVSVPELYLSAVEWADSVFGQ